MAAEEEKAKTLQKIQILYQQLLVLQERLQLLKKRYEELSFAIEELKKAEEKGETEVFEFLGANIIVKKNIKDVRQSKEEELQFLKKQIELLEKQINVGNKELNELLKKSGLLGKPEEGAIS